MAVYTTEVRTLATQMYSSKYNVPVGTVRSMPIPSIIGGVYSEMLPLTFLEGGGLTQEMVSKAILRHYWMREIGLETAELWRYLITTRIDEVMPKYVEMALMQQAMGSIFDNAGYSEQREYGRKGSENETGKETTEKTFEGSETSSAKEDGTTSQSMVDTKKNVTTNDLTDSRNATRTDALKEVVATDNATSGKEVSSADGTTNSQNLYSDTPQNGLSNVKQGQYLTNATIDSQDSESSQTIDRTGTETGTVTKDNTGTVKDVDTLTRTGSVTSQNSGGTTDSGSTTKEATGSRTREDTENQTKDNTVDREKQESGNESVTRTGFSGDKVKTMWDFSQMYVNIMQMIIGEVAEFFMGVIG